VDFAINSIKTLSHHENVLRVKNVKTKRKLNNWVPIKLARATIRTLAPLSVTPLTARSAAHQHILYAMHRLTPFSRNAN